MDMDLKQIKSLCLTWIIEDNLEEKLNQTLSKMEIGQISGNKGRWRIQKYEN